MEKSFPFSNTERTVYRNFTSDTIPSTSFSKEENKILTIDALQCLHFTEYSMHALITGRQKQTNSKASWKHLLAFSSSFNAQMKTYVHIFYFVGS